jgi:hypothetical protein
MKLTVFYAWQSDVPSKEGRNFIENALKTALKRLIRDVTVDAAVRGGLEFDKDTLNVPGCPPIFDTILDKISKAAVFVPDLTFVGQCGDGKPTPNPNVLIEYGWALKSLGFYQIIPVMNEAYGKASKESMPFDMAHLRFPITYNLPENPSEEIRQVQREALIKSFEKALHSVFESEEFQEKLPKQSEPPPDPAQEVVRSTTELANEMRSALESPEGKLVREFFVLPNHRVTLGGSSKPRFIFYEDDHPIIMSQLDLLEEHGLVKDVTPVGNNVKIYRMSEKLVAQLRTTSQIAQG